MMARVLALLFVLLAVTNVRIDLPYPENGVTDTQNSTGLLSFLCDTQPLELHSSVCFSYQRQEGKDQA